MDRRLGLSHRSGGSAGRRGGEEGRRKKKKKEKERVAECLSLSPELFSELNNLTVIDLHVTRSAVHLINVVADLKKKKQKKQKGHFITFYQPPSELHHSQKVQKSDCRATFFIVVCHREGFFKWGGELRWVGVCCFFFFFKSNIFLEKQKNKKQKHVKHDSLPCSYLVLRLFFFFFFLFFSFFFCETVEQFKN